jgi:membrane protease subunit HflK
LQESQAYKGQVVARAEGDASRFEQLLPEYRKAPGVTRERLYLEALEQVLSTTSKVLVDVPGGNPLLYLPLDKLIKPRESGRDGATPAPTESTPPPSGEESSLQSRDTGRSRVAR